MVFMVHIICFKYGDRLWFSINNMSQFETCTDQYRGTGCRRSTVQLFGKNFECPLATLPKKDLVIDALL